MKIYKDAFISYGRRESLSFVTHLHRLLKLEGYDIWFDKVNIPDGDDYALRIANGIETAHNFIFIIAPRAMESVYCLIELEYARVLGKRVIPIAQYAWVEGSEKPISEGDQGMMRAFYEKYNLPQVSLKTEKEVVQHAYALIGRTDWLHAKEEVNTQDIIDIAQWASMYENSFREHENVEYLKKATFPKFGKSIDPLADVLISLRNVMERHKWYVEQHTDILASALVWENFAKKTQYLLVGEERVKAQNWLMYRFPYGDQAPCFPSNLHINYLSDSRKNAENLTTDVFISYAVIDREIMRSVNSLLMKNGFTTWLHSHDIDKGKEYGSEINRGIEDSSNFLFFMSTHSLQSEWCIRELTYAQSLNKRIITLKIDDFDPSVMPTEISGLQFIDFTDNKNEDDFRKDIDEITKHISEDDDYYHAHKMFLSQGLRWQRQLHKNALLLRGYNLELANTWLRLHNSRKNHPPTDLHKQYIHESNVKKGQLDTEVFISYSRKDADFARKLNRALQDAGKTTWFDQESISEGVDFDTEIFKGISQSYNFIFIISPDSLASKFCDDEIRFAAEQGKRFIPILLRESENAAQKISAVSSEYGKINWTFFEDATKFNENLISLIQAIDLDHEHVHAHTKWQERAYEWNENEKSSDYLLNISAFKNAKAWLSDSDAKSKIPAPTHLQREFIQQSEQAIIQAENEQKKVTLTLKKRLRIAGIAMSVAGILVIVTLYFVYVAFNTTLISMKNEQNALKQNIKAQEILEEYYKSQSKHHNNNAQVLEMLQKDQLAANERDVELAFRTKCDSIQSQIKELKNHNNMLDTFKEDGYSLNQYFDIFLKVIFGK